MRFHTCSCGQPVFFNNSLCIACGRAVGFDPDARQIRGLDVVGDGVFQYLPPDSPSSVSPTRYRFCENLQACGCNWLIPAQAEAPPLCLSCQSTRVLPDLTRPDNEERWSRLEAAKRRLLYTLLDLHLWGSHSHLPAGLPLVFDFLESLPSEAPVLTGHDSGVITLNVQEADDLLRETTRLQMREPYRALLGHFRHESGHYYWERLIHGSARLEGFRALFGDETADYAAALQRHYQQGPPPGWEAIHISAYAAAHPWEDWAETWAHYLHMQDTQETAEAAGCYSDLTPPQIDPALLSEEGMPPTPEMALFAERISRWVALTTLVNELTRSMGQPDVYPFAPSAQVLKKLFFIDRLMSEIG